MSTWYEEAFFYHIYPLGLCGAEERNPALGGAVDFHKNRLSGLFAWIPYLQDMGITALYIGPLFESESHGYDTLDYFKVDRRLGDNNELLYFVKECHKAGIKVILDGVFNHVSREFFAFRDLREHRENSAFRDWFHTDFGGNNGYNDGFCYEGWNGHDHLVKLNLRSHAAREHLFDAVRFWIGEFDIDGIRLDAADCLDDDFLGDLRKVCESEKRDFFLLGEIIHGDYSHWANPDTLHSVTNYEAYKGLWSSLVDRNYYEIAWTLNRQFGPEGVYRNLPLYSFVDNHDVDRVAGRFGNPADLYLLYVMLFAMPGVPSVYYGSERGRTGAKVGGDDRPMRPALRLSENEHWGEQRDLRNLISRLARIRREHPVLITGDYRQVSIANEQLVFERFSGNTQVFCLFNQSGKTAPFELPGGRYRDLLNPEEGVLEGSRFEVAGSWARMLQPV